MALVPSGTLVHTWPLTLGSIALIKRSLVIVGRFVPVATHDVVDVRAPLCAVLFRVEASTNAEFVGTDEVLPFVHSLPVATGAREDEATDRVARTRSSVRVELSTFVTARDVDLGEVTDTSHLYERGRLEEMSSLDGSIGNQTSTVAS